MFTKKDFKDQYVLGRRKYLAGKETGHTSVDCSICILRGMKNDTEAISQACEIIAQARARACPGIVVDAALYYNDRLVKNFGHDES